jgi:spermidine synthase
VQILRPPDSWNLGLRRFIPPFLLGFLATAFQIILLREFSAYFYGNELTLGIVLASWLLWGGLGSLLVSEKRAAAPLAGRYELALILLPVSLAVVRLARFGFRLLPGEQVGLAGAVIVALAAGALVSFPLGRLFVQNVRSAGGRIARVYVLESLGAGLAGLVVELALLPYLSNWQAAAAVGAFGLVLISLAAERGRFRPQTLTVAAVLASLVVLDLPSQKLYWRPYEFVTGRDTRHGKLQVIRTGEQLSFYGNGARMFSWPDPAAAEEAVHFALLQNPRAGGVLLIGGGAGGSLEELLKYPRVEVDYVELDPELIRLAGRLLGDGAKEALDDPRVHLHFEDGRSYLARAEKRYDMVILGLPGPATAQINRFYTKEFFELVRQRLSPEGVFSFSLASAENYIGPELQDLLNSLYGTLKSAFSEVEVVPGDTSIFLASSWPLSLDPGVLAERLQESGVATRYITRVSLAARLHPLRRQYLESRLAARPGRRNSDLTPVTFFYESLFWSSQFRGLETKMLRFFSSLPVLALLAVPFGLLAPWLVVFRVRKNRSGYLLTPLVIMGLTTIAVEIILLIWFQSLFGYLYGRIALLLSSFMLGLFAGGWVSSKTRPASLGRLAVTELGMVLLLCAFLGLLAARPPQFLPFLLLFLFGAVGGDLFIVSNRLYFASRKSNGLGYGLELLGSFLGALVTSSLLIPLAGLRALLASITLLNILVLAFLLTRPRGLDSNSRIS